MNTLGSFDSPLRAKGQVGRLQCLPIKALPDVVIPAVLIFEILLVLLDLNVKTNLVENM
jgi:hypothetical protein